VDKYSWVDIGSSFLANEITAAFLYAQLERADELTKRRVELWNIYCERLEPLERQGKLARPAPVPGCEHNGHIFWIHLNDTEARDSLAASLKARGIGTAFHYVPLHGAPMGSRFSAKKLPMAEEYANRLLRLPLFHELTPEEIAHVTDAIIWNLNG
jgi:dTDP-4-amino-4,6-dideoxygalactose transaminase